jgi:hypothetical protein
MSHLRDPRETVPVPPASPLVMCDRLLALAKDADRSGFSITAEHLLHLAFSVLEEPPLHV